MILSIIIPVYNVEKFVERCIRSCEDQDLPEREFELVVVNDGSPDGSLAIVESLAKEFSNMKIISQENSGLSVARNTGMKNACGEYYMFVDSDDWIAKNCLGKLTTKLKMENPDALAICAANVIDDVPKRRHAYPDETMISGRDLLKMGVSPCAPFAIWKASFLKKYSLEFYRGIFHEDSEFTPRAYYLAEKVSRLNDLVYFVYQNPTSITRSVNSKKSFDLVEVVCVHLSDFSKQVDREYKVVFYDLIGLYLNNAMSAIKEIRREERQRLNLRIAERNYLWNDVRKSSVLKYRIEAYLIGLFKNHPLKVYELMQLFNHKMKV